MTRLRVLVGGPVQEQSAPVPCPLAGPTADSAEIRVHWDCTDVPAGEQSVPALLAARLPEIREQLVRFVYELGRLSVNGLEVQEHLKAGESLSLWWCSLLFEKHPKVTPDIYPALKARALELYIQEQNISHITLHGTDERLRALLHEFCARSGRSFSHDLATTKTAPHTTKSLLKRCYFALPAPCKAMVRALVWWWKVRRHLPRTGSPALSAPAGGTTGATIATYFPNIDQTLAREGRFRSRYWESLHDVLCPPQGQSHKVHWLFMLFPSPQYSFAQCCDLRDSFAARSAAATAEGSPQHSDGASFHFLEEFLYPRDLAAACWRYLRLALSSACIQSAVRQHCALPHSHMNLWPYLGPYFADSFRGWRCLERCLQQKAFTRYVAWAGPQEWTLFPLENCPWERMLTHAVHQAPHGTSPVYGAQHSTVRPTDFRYFDDARTFSTPDCTTFQPDRICGNGQGACQEMLAAGLPPERMGMIEALRYMYLYRAAGPYPPRSAEGRLLIVTSFFADEVADHMRVLADASRAGILQGWQITIKAHPYLAVDSYLQELLPAHDFHLSTAPIGELLTAGTMVWASNSTTVALEAAVQGLPVMVQLPTNDVDLCPLQGIEGVARIANATHVAAALRACTHARIAPDYLALDPALPRWRKLLHLPAAAV